MEGNGWLKARELQDARDRLAQKLTDEVAESNRLRRRVHELRDALVMAHALLQAEKAHDALDYVDGYLTGLIEREACERQ